jgi:hypothetical protein
VTPERWLLRYYLLYVLADNPTLSVREIAGMLEQGEFPFKAGKSKINEELMQMSIKSGGRFSGPDLLTSNAAIERHLQSRFKLI